MFGRSAKSALLLIALASTPAYARKQNFTSGSAFGVGLIAGLERVPRNDFTGGTQATNSNYGRYYAFEPFFDLLNLQLRLHGGWHFYPEVGGSGTDGYGTFVEKSDAGSFDYGARLLLSPWMSSSFHHRLYFVAGVGMSNVKLKNSRTYTSGGMFDQTNTERLEASGTELNGGVGFEFFLVQNYSLALEFGYASRKADRFTYKSTTDVTRAPRSESDVALQPDGTSKGFHVWSPYFQLALNLNL
ncbi:MAG TPA: outer membrane beta-barrel protein [Bdellovibrionota bacterium]|jgi:hypothetical protein